MNKIKEGEKELKRKIVVGTFIMALLVFAPSYYFTHNHVEDTEQERQIALQLNERDQQLMDMGRVNSSLEIIDSLKEILNTIPKKEQSGDGQREIKRLHNVVKQTVMTMDERTASIEDKQFIREYELWKEQVNKRL